MRAKAIFDGGWVVQPRWLTDHVGTAPCSAPGQPVVPAGYVLPLLPPELTSYTGTTKRSKTCYLQGLRSIFFHKFYLMSLNVQRRLFAWKPN